jgi:hypothetical protein
MLGEFTTFNNSNVVQFKDCIKTEGQVCIQITSNTSIDSYHERKEKIKNKLDESGFSYKAKYIIMQVPNITKQITIS